MEIRIRTLLKKSTLKQRALQLKQLQPGLAWVIITKYGELWLYEKEPVKNEHSWAIPSHTYCHCVCVGTLRGVARAYGWDGMRRHWQEWCWPMDDFVEALTTPLPRPPRITKGALKKGMAPLMKKTAHLDDFWL